MEDGPAVLKYGVQTRVGERQAEPYDEWSVNEGHGDRVRFADFGFW